MSVSVIISILTMKLDSSTTPIQTSARYSGIALIEPSYIVFATQSSRSLPSSTPFLASYASWFKFSSETLMFFFSSITPVAPSIFSALVNKLSTFVKSVWFNQQSLLRIFLESSLLLTIYTYLSIYLFIVVCIGRSRIFPTMQKSGLCSGVAALVEFHFLDTSSYTGRACHIKGVRATGALIAESRQSFPALGSSIDQTIPPRSY